MKATIGIQCAVSYRLAISARREMALCKAQGMTCSGFPQWTAPASKVRGGIEITEVLAREG